MKKWLAAAVVLSMLAAVPVMAGEDISAGDATVELPGEVNADFSFKDEQSFEITPTSDVVTIDGNHYTIDTALFHYDINLDPTLGFVAFTQDYVASLANYWMLNDSEGFLNLMIENGLHFALMSMDGKLFYLREFEGDPLSEKVGNLTGIPDELQAAVLEIFKGMGFSNGEIVKAGETAWMRMDNNFFITIIDSKYVFATWESEQPMSEYDALDAQDILTGITITSR